MAAFFMIFGSTIGAILFIHLADLVDLDADERLPRGGPGDVLSKPIPRLRDAGLGGAPISERPYRFRAKAPKRGALVPGKPEDGWERVYRSPLSADGTITLRLDAARELVREVELPRPARPVTWEGLAGPRAWGAPASTTGDGEAQVSRWAFPIAGDDVVDVSVRWHGARPGVIDVIRWTRESRR